MTRIEHIGIAVTDPKAVRSLLRELLGLEAYKVETVESEEVDTHFIGADGVKLELLETRHADSSVGRFLQRRGGGIHHVAFEVESLEDILERAARLGLTPINDEPKDGADGKRVFFLHPKETYGILIEVCRAERFAGSRRSVPMPHGEVTAFEAGRPGAPAVLLLHDAGSAGLRSFGGLMARLEPHLRAIAFDAPGHGASAGWAPESHFLRAADRHALAVLDELDVKSAVIAGVGVGAAAAAATAVRAPDRVPGLVLVDPNLLWTDEDVQSASEAIERNCGDERSELASHLTSTLSQAAEASVSADRLREPPCPLLLCGTGGATTRRTLALHDQLDRSSLALLPDFDDRDGALARLLIRFADAVKS